MSLKLIHTINVYKIFVARLPWTVGENELKTYFSQYGKVDRTYVVFDKKTGLSKGYGFVTFEDKNVVDYLSKKTNLVLEGQKLAIHKTK